jgi:hypothetical protein
MLTGLLTTATMTIRSDAAGYEPQEIVIQPSAGPQMALLFTPTQNPEHPPTKDLWCCGCPNDRATLGANPSVRAQMVQLRRPHHGWASQKIHGRACSARIVQLPSSPPQMTLT